MNKRQYKKYLKKLKCRSYYSMRQKRIVDIANKYINTSRNHDFDAINMVYIVDSKRMDLKHPHSVKLLCDCTPVSCKSVNGKLFDSSCTLEWSIDNKEANNE